MPEVDSLERQAPASVAKSGAALLAGRQAGAALFMLAVLALPRFVDRATVDVVVWAMFAVLFLSSILNLGLERATSLVAGAERATGAVRTSAGGLMRLRLLSLPITLAAVSAVLWIAQVDMSIGLVTATFLWTAAVQVQGIGFAVHRAWGHRYLEPSAALAGRSIQAGLLLALAASGQGAVAMVATMAFVDAVVAVAACVSSGLATPGRSSWTKVVPPRSVAMFTLVELFGFAYLRVDALLVARIMGTGAGASYNLVYRVVDAVNGLATPFLLVLLPFAAGLVASKRSLAETRSTLRLAPLVATVIAAIAILLSVPLAAAVPRLEESAGALRLLLAATPLYFFSAFELHLRSAEGRNGHIAGVGAGILGLNVVCNLVAVPMFGLRGAAISLLITEAVQAVWVIATGRRNRHALLAIAPTLVVAVVALVLVGLAVEVVA